MAGYYRSFIPDFAGIAGPLFQGLKDSCPESFEPSQEIKDAVDSFKSILSQKPILQYPDFSKNFLFRN